tara:strand:- start:1512 stop:2861 length:1350 start_codon:yes stop_codon:yes gene_type:complete
MNKKFSVLIKGKIEKFNKTIKIPSDKSLSLRSLILASQCIGISKIKNLLESEDVLNCIKALKKLGVKIIKDKNIHLVYGNGLNSFKIKKKITKIFVGNSGTTARLLSGLLSTSPNKFYIYGDKSMNRRDMTRVIRPLEKIGCFFYPTNKTTLPLTLEGTSIPLAQKHIESKGSAQVKSLILLSALSTQGTTIVEEKKISRNHTEIFLKAINADIKVMQCKGGNLIKLTGQKNLHSFKCSISSDPSSLAFLVALTLLTEKSKLIVHNVLCNPTRMGFIKILKEKMNANINVTNLKRISGELVGSIIVKSSSLKNVNCPKELIPSLIDELPILFVIAALTKGISKFKSINEATKKESNRIKEMGNILSKLGILCKSTNDQMIIRGRRKINNKKIIVVDTEGDHRICMSSAILGLVTGAKIKIKNFETVNTSFPGFITLIKNIGGKLEVKKN